VGLGNKTWKHAMIANTSRKNRRITWSEIDIDVLDVGLANCSFRWMLAVFGWAMVGLGLIGVVVPGMPTTIFLLIALWAFSKSSKRFHAWLWTHPRFGPPLRAWREHKVIPRRAKILAVTMMTASFVYVAVFVAESWVPPALLAAVMAPAAAYIVGRASEIPVVSPKWAIPVRIEIRESRRPAFERCPG